MAQAYKISHAETYKKGVAQFIHSNRETLLYQLLSDLNLPNKGQLADFGCSDGYIIENLRKTVFAGKDWRYVGLDHAQKLIDLGIAKKLPNTTFGIADLNVINHQFESQYDVVLCLETLEHVGDYANALENLYLAAKVDGDIIITIPNEVGLPGFVKYAARRILRRDAYGDFFKGKSEWKYMKHLLTGKPIDMFRQPAQDSWGPHLGFDSNSFHAFIMQELVDKGKVNMIQYFKTDRVGFNIFYHLKRLI